MLHSLGDILLGFCIAIFNMIAKAMDWGRRTARRIVRKFVNIYVFFWFLKLLQKRIVDPLLDISIGATTLNGWRHERISRKVCEDVNKHGFVAKAKQGWMKTDTTKSISSSFSTGDLKVSTMIIFTNEADENMKI